MKRIGYLTIVVVTAFTVGCNRDNRTAANASSAKDSAAVGTSGQNDSNKVSKSDQDFVRDVGVANMAEIELGKIATDRAANPEVKKFGQLMIDDHTKAGDKLKAVASQHNIPVPEALDKKHSDLRDKLAKLNGPDFDREYMDAMVDGHEDFVDKLESRVDKTKLAEWKAQLTDRTSGKKVREHAEAIAVTPEKSDSPVTMSINQWAAETYPVAVAHLTAAKELDTVVKKKSTTN